jgi:hypothetical protein
MRVKLDMSAANKALRDPVAFRCNLTHHWRTGHEYKVGAASFQPAWIRSAQAAQPLLAGGAQPRRRCREPWQSGPLLAA